MDQQESTVDEDKPAEEKAPEHIESEDSSESEAEAPSSEEPKEPSKPKVEKKPRKETPEVEQLKQEFETLATPEEKLRHTIKFMEKALAQKGAPQFRSFWDARKYCIVFFKKNISAALRGVMWERYQELTKEARRLKEILDEQSSFAVEQIEIAIKSVEEEITSLQDAVKKAPAFKFPVKSRAVADNLSLYVAIQQELSFLNTLATRVNTLRKELIKTEMRIRHKNKFFQRLSAIGDKVFPRRKELIKQVSERFIEDIETFCSQHFSQGLGKEPSFALRDEVKNLQAIAKSLTLNTKGFTLVRKQLSACWDKLREQDKELKKAFTEKKGLFQENAKLLSERITAVKEKMASEEMSMDEAEKLLSEVSHDMRKTELGRDEVKQLRDELTDVRKPIQEKAKAHEEERQRQKQERKRAGEEKIQQFHDRIHALLEKGEAVDVEAVESERTALAQLLKEIDLMASKKEALEKELMPIDDLLFVKKDESLEKAASDAEGWKAVLEHRKERHQLLKGLLDNYRKASSASGLDFEQLMFYNEWTSLIKELLATLNTKIAEAEGKV